MDKDIGCKRVTFSEGLMITDAPDDAMALERARPKSASADPSARLAPLSTEIVVAKDNEPGGNVTEVPAMSPDDATSCWA